MDIVKGGYTQYYRGTNIPTGECLDYWDTLNWDQLLKYDYLKEDKQDRQYYLNHLKEHLACAGHLREQVELRIKEVEETPT